MFTINYVIRSQIDGKYLVARNAISNVEIESYLLVFAQYEEALSYINTHGQEFATKLAVESVTPSSLKSLMQRWNYEGIGVVEDPLIPRINFMTYGDRSLS